MLAVYALLMQLCADNVARFAPYFASAGISDDYSPSEVAVHDAFLDERELSGMRDLSQWLLRRTIATEAKHMKRAAEIFPRMRGYRELKRRYGSVLLDVQARVNELAGLPTNDETWQIFFVAQDKPWPVIPPFHHDKSGDTERWLTVLIYLSDVPPEAGGRTLFPCFAVGDRYDSSLCDSLRAGFTDGERILRIRAPGTDSDTWNATASDLIAQQCKTPTALAVTPIAGRAVVWESAANSTGEPLDYMWHGSCALAGLGSADKAPARAVVQFFKRWSSSLQEEL